MSAPHELDSLDNIIAEDDDCEDDSETLENEFPDHEDIERDDHEEHEEIEKEEIEEEQEQPMISQAEKVLNKIASKSKNIFSFLSRSDYEKLRKAARNAADLANKKKSNSCDKRDILSYSRREKSLEELSKKFLSLFLDKSESLLSLDKITNQLGVERRRIYDIINILESLKLVSRKGKNNYKWNGFNRIYDTISFYDSRALTKRDEQEMMQETTKREKSLEMLSIGFLKLFLHWKKTMTLEEAARKLSSRAIDEHKIKTKIRRLYDIANVFKSLGLIQKTSLSDTKKPAFEWIGTGGLDSFAQKIIAEKNGRQENQFQSYSDLEPNLQKRRILSDKNGQVMSRPQLKKSFILQQQLREQLLKSTSTFTPSKDGAPAFSQNSASTASSSSSHAQTNSSQKGSSVQSFLNNSSQDNTLNFSFLNHPLIASLANFAQNSNLEAISPKILPNQSQSSATSLLGSLMAKCLISFLSNQPQSQQKQQQQQQQPQQQLQQQQDQEQHSLEEEQEQFIELLNDNQQMLIENYSEQSFEIQSSVKLSENQQQSQNENDPCQFTCFSTAKKDLSNQIQDENLPLSSGNNQSGAFCSGNSNMRTPILKRALTILHKNEEIETSPVPPFRKSFSACSAQVMQQERANLPQQQQQPPQQEQQQPSQQQQQQQSQQSQNQQVQSSSFKKIRKLTYDQHTLEDQDNKVHVSSSTPSSIEQIKSQSCPPDPLNQLLSSAASLLGLQASQNSNSSISSVSSSNSSSNSVSNNNNNNCNNSSNNINIGEQFQQLQQQQSGGLF